jgi:hypothetical protein
MSSAIFDPDYDSLIDLLVIFENTIRAHEPRCIEKKLVIGSRRVKSWRGIQASGRRNGALAIAVLISPTLTSTRLWWCLLARIA